MNRFNLMTNRLIATLLVGLLVLHAAASTAETLLLDFEELTLSGSDHYNGSDGAGEFVSRGASFNNQYASFGNDCCWNGWAYANAADASTPGPSNQYSAYPGGGAGNSEKFAVAFSGLDSGGGIVPVVTLPTGAQPLSLRIANTTYAALSMRNGDGFAKRFGGDSGTDPDWFLLTILGQNQQGQTLGEVPYYLADFRSSDPLDDYILNTWQQVDLSPLASPEVAQLAFRFSSSDVGAFGMNTPAYAAVDDLRLTTTQDESDFNGDGQVDGQDLTLWQEEYGVSVDGADYLVWQRQRSPTSIVSAARTTVPEPSNALLALFVFTVSQFFRHRLKGSD